MSDDERLWGLLPETWAAVVSGALLGAVPLVGLILSLSRLNQTSSGPEHNLISVGLVLRAFLLSSIPALIATWRTRVHVRRVRLGQERGWQGVLEAGSVGFVLAVILVRQAVNQGKPGVFYALLNGVIGIVVGLAFGLLLALTSWLVLKLFRTLARG